MPFSRNYSELAPELPVYTTYLPFTARTKPLHNIFVNGEVQPELDTQTTRIVWR